MSKLMPVAVAIKEIVSDFSPVDIELVNIQEINNRIIADDFFASLDLPSFDNSSMDGYALRAEDTLGASPDQPKRFTLVEDIRAGDDIISGIDQGQAARIVTGARLPAGANAVIPVEETNIEKWEPGTDMEGDVWVMRQVTQGENIRYRGQYIKRGRVLIKKGEMIKPSGVGIVASQGVPVIKVFRKPRIGLFSSGDELLTPGEAYKEGRVFDSNTPMLEALIRDTHCEAIRSGTGADSENSIKSILDKLVEKEVDLIISSAGVSMGAHDYVRYVIERNGKLNLWRVNMRPGKPIVYGSYGGIPFIGLPGNPVSAFVGFLIFIQPVLSKLKGEIPKIRFSLNVPLDKDIESDGRESYLRGTVYKRNGEFFASLVEDQASGNLFSVVESNSILIIPQDVYHVPKGSLVEAFILKDLLN